MSRIAAIEDDGALRSDLVDHLKDWGHKVAEARDAKTGVGLIESWPPVIFLCDVELSSGNGFQIAEWVREQHPDTVIIFISALKGRKERLLVASTARIISSSPSIMNSWPDGSYSIMCKGARALSALENG